MPHKRLPLACPRIAEHVPRGTWLVGVPPPPGNEPPSSSRSCGCSSPWETLSKPESIFLPPPPQDHDCHTDRHKVHLQNSRTLLLAPGTSPAHVVPEQGLGRGWTGSGEGCSQPLLQRTPMPSSFHQGGSSWSRQVQLCLPHPGGDSASPHQRCLRSEERGRRGREKSIQGIRLLFTCPYGWGGR